MRLRLARRAAFRVAAGADQRGITWTGEVGALEHMDWDLAGDLERSGMAVTLKGPVAEPMASAQLQFSPAAEPVGHQAGLRLRWPGGLAPCGPPAARSC